MTLALLAFGALVALLVLARYRHAAVVKDWSGVLSPEAAEVMAQLEHGAEMDRVMMQDAWSRAQAAHGTRNYQEAVRMLELLWFVVNDATPSRLERLRNIARVCRQAAAVVELPPVAPGVFRLHRLKTLAGLAAVVHVVLVAAPERAWLRARMLIAAFGLLLWSLRRAKEGAIVSPEVWAAWRKIDAILGDWRASDVATLESYRAARMTLAQEMRGN